MRWVKTVGSAEPDCLARYGLAKRYASGRVLDAACGCGYGSKILLDSAQLVVGVDESAQAIHWAEEHFQGPYFIQGRIEEEPWTGKFETVVSLETIEHIKDPKEALKALRRACIGTLIASGKGIEDILNDCGFKVTERFCLKEGYMHAGTDGDSLIVIAE